MLSIYSIEQLSGKSTSIHRLHPAAKLVSAFVYIVTVVSFHRYAFLQLIPYVFYPTIMMALSETPYSLLHKRAALALPFCMLAGISSLILDTATAFRIGSLSVSYGVLAFFCVLLKTYLCVMAVLLLVATTPFARLTDTFRALCIPSVFISVFEMTYRYIGTLLLEAGSLYTAYRLRGGNRRGVDIRHMGSFVGQLLLKSIDRSERVYNAMQCRGYALHASRGMIRRISAGDWIYMGGIAAAIIFFRLFDITTQWNTLIGGLLS